MNPKQLFRLFLLALFITIVASYALIFSRSNQTRLVVLLVVDQFRPDYFERFSPLLSGGLREVYEHGIEFTNASYQYALTETCPGHATIVTGSHPRTHGIVSNHWLDRDTGKEEYCVAYAQQKKSPSHLLKSTLGDWIKDNNSQSQIYSIAGKDRSGIMLGGYSADAALWFDTAKGEFVSSGFYTRLNTSLLKQLNKKVSARKYFGMSWSPSPQMERLKELGTAPVVILDQGDFASAFPHPLGGLTLAPDERFYADFASSPLLDVLTLDAARFIVESAALGGDSSVDLLAIGLSAHDRLGHAFGPDSPEVLDSIVKIDTALQTFLQYLDRAIGREHYLLVLTSDHGVRSLPEALRAKGIEVRRPTAQDTECVQQAAQRVAIKVNSSHLFLNGLYLNPSALETLSVAREELDQLLTEELLKCSFIERVVSSKELERLDAAGLATDDSRSYLFNSHFSSRSPDYYLLLKDEVMDSPGRDASHGSMASEDRNVPVIFMGAGLSPGKSSTAFGLQDLAPTLASFLHVRPIEAIEGFDQSSELRRVATDTK